MNEIELSVLNRIEKNVKLAWQYSQAYQGNIWVMYGSVDGYYWYSLARNFKSLVNIFELKLQKHGIRGRHPTFNIGYGHLEPRSIDETNQKFQDYWDTEHSIYRSAVISLAGQYLKTGASLDFIKACDKCPADEYCDTCSGYKIVLKQPTIQPSKEVLERKSQILQSYCKDLDESNVNKFDVNVHSVFDHLPFNFHLQENQSIEQNNDLLNSVIESFKQQENQKSVVRTEKLKQELKARALNDATKYLTLALGLQKEEAANLAELLIKANN